MGYDKRPPFQIRRRPVDTLTSSVPCVAAQETRKFMYKPWTILSKAEAVLSKEIALFLVNNSKNKNEIAKDLLDLAQSCSKANRFKSFWFQKFPQLEELDVKSPFPKNDEHLSTNLFGIICYEVINLFEPNNLKGVVGTPLTLALDMIRVATAFRLSSKFSEDSGGIYTKLLNSNIESRHCESIKNFQIYDPCVGWGNYAIGLLIFYNQLGIELNEKIMSNFLFRDIEPLYIESAKIRVAYLMQFLSNFAFSSAYQSLNTVFEVKNSLNTYKEEKEMWENNGDGRLFDVIVANPPYVRSDEIPATIKSRLTKDYPYISGGKVDLYNYFIAHGILALNTDGVLCYVSPATFQNIER